MNTSKPPTLSPMQTEVLILMVEYGLTQDQIALRLHRKRDTIKHYCKEIKDSFGVESLYQAIGIAVSLGIVAAPHLRK